MGYGTTRARTQPTFAAARAPDIAPTSCRGRFGRLRALLACCAALAASNCTVETSNGGASGSGGSGGSGGATATTGTGTTGSTGGGAICEPGATEPCYSGPAGTAFMGLCVAGTRTCNAEGSAFDACTGEVTPVAETCTTAGDDDCDGEVNEEGDGCTCVPGTVVDCYGGPLTTEGVGPCKGGQQTCHDDGLGFGPCVGEVTPLAETCATPEDDDCDGQVNEEGADCVCLPSSTAPCYTGPAGTQGVGPCVAGTKTCNAAGTGFGACVGEVTPAPETCNTAADDDCDGQVNEEGLGCLCVPGTTSSCYSGPAATENVGACVAGQQTCDADGTGYGPCTGEVTPVAETCDTADDDDCDGLTNEEGTGCPVICVPGSVSSCYSGPPDTENIGACKSGQRTCSGDGTAYGPCMGEVTPVAETCNTFVDDDCDGLTNEEGSACTCVPFTIIGCYWGPIETLNVGPCHAGYEQCSPDGLFWSPCQTQITPQPETCGNNVDDDCDGQVNEGC